MKYIWLLLGFSFLNCQPMEELQRKIRMDREITRCVLLQRVQVIDDAVSKLKPYVDGDACPLFIVMESNRLLEDKMLLVRVIRTLGRA